ncbi:MAG TPA: M28 family peptidase, partial [Phaeodactylibacter sp.]|nr:M28 family peptidase [Phaeodactylibacter sp.]
TSSTTSSTPPASVEVKIPKFNRDSAYIFTEKQVAFGARVPNSEAHKKCKKWYIEKFKSLGADVIEQDFQVKSYENKTLHSTNIIAQFNPENTHRVVLASHWDSRHHADQDQDKSKKKQPVMGADDGASGVGMLLEIARQIQLNKIDLGVDIVLFDAEDQGSSGGKETTWCLGSQYWAKHLHRPNYKPKFGILLDMAGAKNARFTKEEYSLKYAPNVVNKVWKIAKERGYGNYFVNEKGGPLIDDHLFVNTLAKIPMIDIINRPQNSRTGFGDYWHTHKDNMSVIHKSTLRAVGQTLLATIYREAAGTF